MLRKAGITLLLALACVAGWGWVRLLLEVDTIMRHERQLATHAGGLVNHEGRIEALEQAIGDGRPAPTPRKPTYADIVCSDASLTRRPELRAKQP